MCMRCEQIADRLRQSGQYGTPVEVPSQLEEMLRMVFGPGARVGISESDAKAVAEEIQENADKLIQDMGVTGSVSAKVLQIDPARPFFSAGELRLLAGLVVNQATKMAKRREKRGPLTDADIRQLTFMADLADRIVALSLDMENGKTLGAYVAPF